MPRLYSPVIKTVIVEKKFSFFTSLEARFRSEFLDYNRLNYAESRINARCNVYREEKVIRKSHIMNKVDTRFP